MRKKVLIVEDENDIVHLIRNRLDAELFDVDTAGDGQQAMEKILAQTFDLVILDIMLPKIDGLQICSHLHRYAPGSFIMIISALSQESDKIRAYELGADSYVSKPFSPKVLASEIMALFRRGNRYDALVQHREIMLIPERFSLGVDGHTIQLTPSEFLIFETLFNHRRQSFTRADLAEVIYDNALGELSERSIDSHIAHIRKKFEPLQLEGLIETVRGRGYAIDVH